MSQGSVDDFLAHYGVKGMKWGVRKARRTTSDGREVATLGERRQMNKAARGRQAEAQKAEIRKRDASIARARKLSPKARDNIKAAKKQYKNDKKVLGRVAAKELMENNTKRDWKTLDRAAEMTQREAQVDAVIQAAFALGKIVTASR